MLKRLFIGVLFTVLPGMLPAADLPAGWSEPTVAHQGIRVIKAGGQTIESRYHYRPPGLHREEMSHEGMSIAMVIRQDRGVIYTFLPHNMYMETSIDQPGMMGERDPIPDTDSIVEFEEVGQEEINGWPTTRYHVITMDEGQRAEGDFWVTEHWIPIRMEFNSSEQPGETMSMEIRDLLIVEQDPALFEVPAGATKLMGMGGFGG